MGKINRGRLALCGVLAGVVWGVLLAIAMPLVGRDFMAALPAGFAGHFPGSTAGSRAIVMISPLVLGISVMWLCAAIRPRYGPGTKTAAVAGFAMWCFGTWVDAIWAALGAVPLAVLVGPVAASLPVTLAAAVVGAWPYKE